MTKSIQARTWLHDGQVYAALGQAYGEAKQFEQAIKYYRLALSTEDSGVTLKDIEQLANLESRDAVARWEAGDEAEAVLKQLDGGTLRLEVLLQSTGAGRSADEGEVGIGVGMTVERLSLLGSPFKRRAWISELNRAESLGKMARYYREAFELGKQKRKFDPYPPQVAHGGAGPGLAEGSPGAKDPTAGARVFRPAYPGKQ